MNRKVYLKEGPIASYSIANAFGVVIYDLIFGADDYVVCAFCNCGVISRITKVKIRYDYLGRPYFIKGSRIYFDDCMRTVQV